MQNLRYKSVDNTVNKKCRATVPVRRRSRRPRSHSTSSTVENLLKDCFISVPEAETIRNPISGTIQMTDGEALIKAERGLIGTFLAN